jgi:hypothetical protein
MPRRHHQRRPAGAAACAAAAGGAAAAAAAAARPRALALVAVASSEALAMSVSGTRSCQKYHLGRSPTRMKAASARNACVAGARQQPRAASVSERMHTLWRFVPRRGLALG